MCQTADPGVGSLIPTWSYTFMEIDHEIISMAILLLALIQEGCCQLQAKVYIRSIGKLPSQACPGKSVFRSTDHLNMTIAVDSDVNIKPTAATIQFMIHLSQMQAAKDQMSLLKCTVLLEHAHLTYKVVK